MSNIPDNLQYRESHEWIDATQDPAPVGITDYAQNALGDVVFVELPKVGRQVQAGEQVAVIESVKAASDIYAPATGEIVAVNDALAGNPALINTDPYAEGWMFKIKTSSTSTLLDAAAYAKVIA
ncbi:MAG: Glycine cleavage system protein [Verrucomicrobiaceae bacterium]|nr:Glycine cleavage system protein [Verrucomicrobiaceae bacterium]